MALNIRFEPSFVEEAVFLELKKREESGDCRLAQAFWLKHNALYEVTSSAEAREAQIQRLSADAFGELGFAGLFAKRFEEFPLFKARLQVAFVRRAWSRREERVELYGPPAPIGCSSQEMPTTLWIGLQVARCLGRDELIAFLRQELMHVSDMLDPAFGYRPHPDLGGECEAEDDLIRERFRLLWNLFVEGRILRRGWPPISDEATRPREFERAFGSWDPKRREAVLEELRTRETCTQRELLDLASDERLTRSLGQGGVRCPLCRFPTQEGVRDWRGEGAVIAEAIRSDYPWWDPAQGACRQCFELYRSRRVGVSPVQEEFTQG